MVLGSNETSYLLTKLECRGKFRRKEKKSTRPEEENSGGRNELFAMENIYWPTRPVHYVATVSADKCSPCCLVAMRMDCETKLLHASP